MKLLLPLLLTLITASLFVSCKKKQSAEVQTDSDGYLVYVGTYTGQGSTGIYVYRMDENSGELSLLHTVADPFNPSFLAVNPAKTHLYAVHELGNYMGKKQGSVKAFQIDQSTGMLTPLNEQASFGQHPCHVSVDPSGSMVMLANYSGGNIASYPILEDGSLGSAESVIQHTGSGANPSRQAGPHAHSITPDSSGQYAVACDLGIDKLLVYSIDSESASLTPAETPFTQTAPGAGPRHLAFHPSGHFAYVINELNSTITAYTWDASEGTLADIQTENTLPESFKDWNSCADIHVTPDGRFLYGSNRGHNSLVIFKIDESSGRLTLVGHQAVGGNTPRNFAIDPSGRFILAANQDTDNIVLFEIDQETGQLTQTGHEISVSKPVCVKIISGL